MHVLGIPTFVFFQYMHSSQVGQHYILRPNFELWKRRHYPIIPTGVNLATNCWPPMRVVSLGLCAGKNGPGKNGPGKNGPGKNGPEKTVRRKKRSFR